MQAPVSGSRLGNDRAHHDGAARAETANGACMTLRPPRSFSPEPRDNPLAYEIARERAEALGRLGRALEEALAALSEFDRAVGDMAGNDTAGDRAVTGKPTTNAARAKLVRQAGYALWCFIVQREASGLRDPRPVLREYRVPAEVQNRMGVLG
jgi:hypothetical protein